MNTVLLVFRRFVQLVVFAFLVACGSDLQSKEPIVTTNDQSTQQAITTVENYVLESKRWEKSSFRIELNRKEGNTWVFWVLHSDDRASNAPGAGKSIEVYLDPVSGKVLKELAFQ